MNDRFKFRVWDVRKEQYLNTDNVFVDADGVCYHFDAMCERFDLMQYDVIVEQCTGLTDKNGKLIYEGDVVKKVFKDGSSMHKEVYYDSVMCRWYLRYCSPGLHSTRQYLFWDFNSSIADKIEVIGNIHEMEVENASKM